MKTMVRLALAGLLASGLFPGLMAASPPGILWDIRRLETARMGLNDVAGDGAGNVIGVGENGVIRISTDHGLTWNTIEDVTRSGIDAVTWTGTHWVAVSGRGFERCLALTSTNGFDWDKCSVAEAPLLRSVASGPPGTVAVGSSEGVVFSPDLVSWSRDLHGSYLLEDVVWTGTRFVAVGGAGVIQTSLDGMVWTARYSGISQNLRGIAWNGSVMVAVGYNNSLKFPLVIVSSDGISWAPASTSTLPVGANLYAVEWTGSRFVAGGLNGHMLTSPDGLAWSHHQVPGATFVQGLAWTGSRLVAVGRAGMILSTAEASPTTAADWVFYASADGVHYLHDLAEGEVSTVKRLVVVGDAGTVLTTDDGAESGAEQTSGVSVDLKGVTTTSLPGHRFMAVGNGGTIITSPDAVTWNPQAGAVTEGLLAVGWFERDAPDPPIAVAVGELGFMETSTNASAWSAATSGTTEKLVAIADGLVDAGGPPGTVHRVVVVGKKGTILTSTDGLAWSSPSSGTTWDLEGVTWFPGGFVVVGQSGTVLTSADGIIWTPQDSGTGFNLFDVSWTGSQLLATGYSGSIFTSPTGNLWTRRYGPVATHLFANTALESGRLLAVGSDGIAISSDPAPDFADWMAAQSPPTGQGGPGDDPNHDGLDNVTAYAFGIPAVATPNAADFAALPVMVENGTGMPVRVGIRPNPLPLPDLVYLAERSFTAQPGTWAEMLRHKPGQECPTGSLNAQFYHSSPSLVTEFSHTVGGVPRFFARFRFELRDPP